MASQAMAPAFFYYSPDPNPENRQHGHFITHPQQVSVFPVVPTLPSTPVYSRPNSSCSQLLPKTFAGVPAHMASPQPLAHRPTIVLDTDLAETEGLYYPSTPPLSTSSSVISSPGSCDMLATPLNPMFSGFEGINDECNVDTEQFPVLDWSSCVSPPLTPGRSSLLFPTLGGGSGVCMYLPVCGGAAAASHAFGP